MTKWGIGSLGCMKDEKLYVGFPVPVMVTVTVNLCLSSVETFSMLSMLGGLGLGLEWRDWTVGH